MFTPFTPVFHSWMNQDVDRAKRCVNDATQYLMTRPRLLPKPAFLVSETPSQEPAVERMSARPLSR
jgi:hypothetical protein